ncbi:hypothetical protein NMG60_11004528 [Bertholletia excelsa]
MLDFGQVPVLIVSSAAAAREILRTHDQIFSSRPKSRLAKRLVYDTRDVVFCPYGEHWRQMRSICVLNLLSNRRVQSFRNVREEETAAMIEMIRNCSSWVNLSEMLTMLSGNMACRVVLGKKCVEEGEGRRLKVILDGLGELLGSFNVAEYISWLAWLNSINGFDAKVNKLAKEVDEFLTEVVEKHTNKRDRTEKGKIENEGKQDLVDCLLDIQSDKTRPINGDIIKAILLVKLIFFSFFLAVRVILCIFMPLCFLQDMLSGGIETTSTTLEWTISELLRHTHILEKLQNEVRQIAGGKLYPTEDDLVKMNYLKAVIKETLRLHPPLPLLIAHESTEDANVMGYDIRAGTQVIINAWAIARDPLTWEYPEEFRPERFLNSSKDFKGKDFEFIPFGAGRRICPGMLLAMIISELALANLVNNFDISLPSGACGEELDMSEATGLAVHRRNPLLVVANPKSS